MNENLKLLMEYSKEGKIADKIFIKKAMNRVIRGKALEDYIQTVLFREEDKYRKNIVPASYMSSARTVIYDDNSLKRVYQTVHDYPNWNFTDFEKKVAGNAMILHTILHEAQQAELFKKSKVLENTFENLLIRICRHADNEFEKISAEEKSFYFDSGILFDIKLSSDMIKNHELKKKYSSSAPITRMTNINAFKELLEILKPAAEEIPNVIRFFNLVLLDTYIRDYKMSDIDVAPTMRYLADFKGLKIRGANEYFDENFDIALEKENLTSLENRLTLGLEINIKEYYETADKIDEIKG